MSVYVILHEVAVTLNELQEDPKNKFWSDFMFSQESYSNTSEFKNYGDFSGQRLELSTFGSRHAKYDIIRS